MTWIWAALCLLVAIIVWFYWYYNRTDNYLERLGIPYIKNDTFAVLKFLFKSMFSYEKINIYDITIERYKKYGRFYGSTELGNPIISVADPDLLRKILVKDFHIFNGRRNFMTGDPIFDNSMSIVKGEKWKRIRTIVSPAFSTGKIKRMTDIIICSATTLTQNFISKAGEPIDGKKFLNSFTMDVIASVAFGTKIHSYQDPNNRFVQEANKFFKASFSWRIFIFILFPKLASFLNIGFLDTKMLTFFKEATLEIIEDRKKNGTVKNDFLQLLIEAEKEHEKEENITVEKTKENTKDEIANELGHEEENAKIFEPTKRYKSLSQNELLAQCLGFFLAGFETTATTLACAFHVLAVDSDIQDKLREEIDTVISEHNNQLTYESVQEMRYLDQFISETLRMYPPAFRLERTVEADYEMEGTGITLKKGTVVVVPVCAIHQDPEFYPEPEKFRPERFTPEEKALRDPYAYLTFGAGSRNCVGMRFALMEIKLCIAYILSQLIIKKCPQTQVSLKFSSPIGLLKPDSIFTVEKRRNSVLQNDS